jgi:hypothetical protein
VLVLYWLAGLASLGTFAKAGAAQNYFLEPWLATVLLSTALTGDAFRAGVRWARGWPLVVLGASAVAVAVQHQDGRLPFPLRNPERALEYRALRDAVRASAGPILSEDLSLLVVNRKAVVVEPFGLVLLSRKGLWKADVLAADCRAGRFPLVIYEHRLREIPGLADCLDTSYVSWQRLGPYELLKPR